jgi:hypothetical protein
VVAEQMASQTFRKGETADSARTIGAAAAERAQRSIAEMRIAHISAVPNVCCVEHSLNGISFPDQEIVVIFNSTVPIKQAPDIHQLDEFVPSDVKIATQSLVFFGQVADLVAQA